MLELHVILCCRAVRAACSALCSPAAALPMHLSTIGGCLLLSAPAHLPLLLPLPCILPCRCSGGRARGGAWWCRPRTIPPNTGTDQMRGTAPSCPCGPPSRFLVLLFVCCSNQVLCHQQRWLLGLPAVHCHSLTSGTSCNISCALSAPCNPRRPPAPPRSPPLTFLAPMLLSSFALCFLTAF